MKIFLAGTASHEKIVREKMPIPFVLESFYYWKEWQDDLLKSCEEFLLDSGAFTFMRSSKKNIDWNDYIKRYADFINRKNIDNFFELDIDSIVGYDNVLKYRELVEKETGKKSIPVWHKSRGIDDFCSTCENYSRVAIGGFAIKEITISEYKYIPHLIQKAHERKSKVHGLGFTSTSYYNKIKFDSVDSTTWTIGGRMGNICYFNGSGMRQYYPSLHKKKPKNMNMIQRHNYEQWLLFQKWAVNNL